MSLGCVGRNADWCIAISKAPRAIRDALLQGQYELRECSASRDNQDLFSFLAGISFKPVEEEQQNGDALESTETNC